MNTTTAQRRVQITLQHLSQSRSDIIHDHNDRPCIVEHEHCSGAAPIGSKSSPFGITIRSLPDSHALQTFLDGRYANIRESCRRQMATDEFAHLDTSDELHFTEQRKVVMSWLKTMVKQLPFQLHNDDIGFWATYTGSMANFGMNANALVKLAVQYSLFGGTIINLGTAEHHKMIDDIQNLNTLGCFGMTEKGHGSNVRGIETTATYDRKTREFVIHTPHRKAMKTWIGGAGGARYSSVFAQLIVDGKNHGVHVFLVPMRDQYGNLLRGVTVQDLGYKMGLNGVDNMAFGFDSVRIPRENLLNRFSNVTPDGRYETTIENESARFAATVGELTGGRITITTQAIGHSFFALAIAIRYGFARRQFSRPGHSGAEVQIMNYPTHFRRLMPLLARNIAYHVAADRTVEIYNKYKGSPFVHSLSSVLKAFVTWHTLELLSTARQCCGGAGFRATGRICTLVRDTHVFATFEGDNSVLCQQTAKFLLNQYKQGKKQGSFADTNLQYADKLDTTAAAASVNNSSDFHNLDRLQRLLQQRELSLIRQMEDKVASRIKNGESVWDAMNNENTLGVHVAKAHCDRLTHEYFQQAIRTAQASIQQVLSLCCLLTTLDAIHSDLGLFLSFEILSPRLAKELPQIVVDVSRELAQYSLSIIDALGIPEKTLGKADLSDY